MQFRVLPTISAKQVAHLWNPGYLSYILSIVRSAALCDTTTFSIQTALFEWFFDHCQKFPKVKFFNRDPISAQNLTLNIFLLHTEVAKTNRFQVMAILLQLSQPQKRVIFLHSRYPPENFFLL